jgi:hypothetical protein
MRTETLKNHGDFATARLTRVDGRLTEQIIAGEVIGVPYLEHRIAR